MSKPRSKIDGDLVKAFQSGDKTALVQLVKRWHKAFCEKAYWIVKDADAAKDIAQDCWQVIIDQINNIKHPENFGGWALRIIYTRSIDVINASNRKRKTHYQLKKQQSTIEESYNENIKLKEQLFKAIKELPPNQQLVIKLFYLEEYSLKAMAELLDISEGTIKSRLFHAREKLKSQLKNRKNEMS